MAQNVYHARLLAASRPSMRFWTFTRRIWGTIWPVFGAFRRLPNNHRRTPRVSPRPPIWLENIANADRHTLDLQLD